jgi:transcriptional regulator with XRE-family HTH domain
LNRNVECPSVGTIFAHSFSERSALSLRYTIAAKKAPNPTDKHVGARVRMRRKMLAMSQEQLADALGITYQQVQKNEKGANRIGGQPVAANLPYPQVPVAFFFKGAPNASAPHEPNGSTLSMAQIDEFVSDSNGLRLIGAFVRIDNAALRGRIVMLVKKLPVTTATRMPGRDAADDTAARMRAARR